MMVRWMSEEEGDGSAVADNIGIFLPAGDRLVLEMEEVTDGFFFKVGAKLDASGAAVLNISAMEYRSIFEE